MPNFEDVQIGAINEVVIDSLVGRKENQRLEFKETIDGVPKYEVVKDLGAMTNGEGGYLIVGAIEDSQSKQCCGFRSVDAPQSVCNRIKDLALQYVRPPLSLAPEVRRTSANNIIVITPIPKSRSPRAIEYDGRTELWKRYETDKRQMPFSEIEKALGSRSQDEEFKAQQLLAADPTRWNEITDRRVLWKVLDEEFRRRVNDRRYLRLTMTPNVLKENLFDLGDRNLQMSLWHPNAGQREHGWNVRVGPWGAQLISDSLGTRPSPLQKNGLRLPFISLTRSGHLEFWAPVESRTFLPPIYWNSEISDDEFLLWPTAVCEYPVSFLRFAKELYSKVASSDELTWRMEYRNLRGCILHPFIPHRGVSLEPPRRYPHAHFEPREGLLWGEWQPDGCAFELIRKFYEAFGLSAKHIPLFADGQFEPDRWQC